MTTALSLSSTDTETDPSDDDAPARLRTLVGSILSAPVYDVATETPLQFAPRLIVQT